MNRRLKWLEDIRALSDREYSEASHSGLFLPVEAIERVLSPNVFVIVGVRGSGKSAIFRHLTQSRASKDPVDR